MHRKFCFSSLVLVLLSCSFAVLVEANYSSGWSKTYGAGSASSLIETPDGGWLVAGTTTAFGAGGYDFLLVKTNASGSVEWKKTYGGRDDESASSLVATSDGGYAIAGQTSPYDVAGYDALLVKIDADGNMMWNRTYEEKGYEGASSVVQTPDGGYAIAGSTGAEQVGAHYFWLVKTDEFGNMEWSRTYSVSDANSMIATSDGGYALVGTTGRTATEKMLLTKTDEHGNLEWSKTYGNKLRNVASSLVETNDGGYAIAGVTNYEFTWVIEDGFVTSIEIFEDFTLIKTDSSGNMEWKKTYGTGSASSVVQTSDDGYALVGGALFVKTDKFGNMEWNKTLSGDGNSLVAKSSRGYVIAGNKDGNFWLTKASYTRQSAPDHVVPQIHIVSPQREIYTTDCVSLNFTVDEETSWIGYVLDGQNKMTITENTMLTGLTDGRHNVVLYATNTDGITGVSEQIYFTIDTMAPVVSILTPEEKTYDTDEVQLNFAVNEKMLSIIYCLDGQTNVTVSENKTLTGLTNGSHTITAYTTDAAGNKAKSETVTFIIAKEAEPEPNLEPNPEPRPNPPPTWFTTDMARALIVVEIITAAAILIYCIKKRREKAARD